MQTVGNGLRILATRADGKNVPIPEVTKEGNRLRFWSAERTVRIHKRARDGKPVFENVAEPRTLTAGIPPISDRLILTKKVEGLAPESVDLSILLGSKTLLFPAWPGSWSYGAATHLTHLGAVIAAKKHGLQLGIGEGGIHPALYNYLLEGYIVPQFASGHFITREALEKALLIEVKFAQNTKVGRGGARRKKWSDRREEELAAVRRMPVNLPVILSPPNLNVSVEEGRDIIRELRNINPRAFILAKCASTDDIDQIVWQFLRAGFNAAILDSQGGATASSRQEWRDFCGGFQNVLAIRRAYLSLKNGGKQDNFSLIGSGRIATALDAYWAIRAGATGVQMATAVLEAMGCIMEQNCNRCPMFITTYPPEHLDTPEMEKNIVNEFAMRVGNFFSAFKSELAFYLAISGFHSVEEARGNMEGVNGDLSRQEETLLGIKTRKSFHFHLPEDGANGLSEVRKKRNDLKRKTGKSPDGYMGTARDIEASDIWDVIGAARPRHWTGPAYDHPTQYIDQSTKLGSYNSYGGLILDGCEDIAPYFGILTLSKIQDKITNISSSEDIQRLIPSMDGKTNGNPTHKFILIEGKTDLEKLELLSKTDKLLRETVRNGRIIRSDISLLLRIDNLEPRKLYVCECLGADALIVKIEGTEQERINFLSANLSENEEFLGASGLDSRAARVGNNSLIAADPIMPEELKERLGIPWFGE